MCVMERSQRKMLLINILCQMPVRQSCSVGSRHVPVFGNMIYHDYEHARYCYCGHFKMP